MDDPDLVWPAWKFGMKRDDLFTTLHDRYNTFSYTLQDPEAFHHDVYEISHIADTTEEFHRFMADRQRQRITELHESLESLAVEIIANPKLMGTDQWQHAVQLFRTKSFDSIVRYFASYLPDEYLDRHGPGSVASSTSSYSETDSIHTISTKASSADDASSPFLDDDFYPHGSVITDEPCSIDTTELPLSPESEGPHAESPESYASTISTNPPSRSMSFSGSESGRLGARFVRRPLVHVDDDVTSQSDDSDTAVTSVCDSTETRSSYDSADDVDAKELSVHSVDGEEEEDDEFPAAQYPEDDFCTFDTHETFSNTYDTLDSDTPTPRQVHESTCYVEYKPAISQIPSLLNHRGRHYRSPSPRAYLARRAEGSPVRDVRRSPEEALCKIQKTLPDPIRRRPKGRRWLD
ncbi:hypothetical protein PT974_06004 [Cladobotryum mycophilum]|uniref:Uncharacterized protein n=1 Tax=Cladobotryum mycophilum TaxID=491253 RepID=A0ABR0SKB3_9HYPO